MAALLSKTVASSMPVVVLLLIWWKRGHVQFVQIMRTMPFLIIGAIFGFVTQYMELYYVGAVGKAFAFTWLQKLSIASRVFWFYLAKLLFPYSLNFNYRRWDIPDGFHWPLLLGGGTVLLALGLWYWRRRIGRAVRRHAAVRGFNRAGIGAVYRLPHALFFCCRSLPISGGIGSGGVLVAAAAIHLPRRISLGLAAIVLAVLATLTFHRCRVFYDSQTLWTDTLAKNPQSWIAHSRLGFIAFNDHQDLDAAEDHFRAAIAIPNCSFWSYEYLGIIADRRGNPARRWIGTIRRCNTCRPATIRCWCRIATPVDGQDRHCQAESGQFTAANVCPVMLTLQCTADGRGSFHFAASAPPNRRVSGRQLPAG